VRLARRGEKPDYLTGLACLLLRAREVAQMADKIEMTGVKLLSRVSRILDKDIRKSEEAIAFYGEFNQVYSGYVEFCNSHYLNDLQIYGTSFDLWGDQLSDFAIAHLNKIIGLNNVKARMILLGQGADDLQASSLARMVMHLRMVYLSEGEINNLIKEMPRIKHADDMERGRKSGSTCKLTKLIQKYVAEFYHEHGGRPSSSYVIDKLDEESITNYDIEVDYDDKTVAHAKAEGHSLQPVNFKSINEYIRREYKKIIK
jgi:hypothetical protein